MLQDAAAVFAELSQREAQREAMRFYREIGLRNLGIYQAKLGNPRYNAYCRSCGAPGETDHCSYCLTRSGP